jgi:hypothetical protein
MQEAQALGSPSRATSGLWGGGAIGNLRLTAVVGAFLVVLLAVEGATIPWIQPLLTVHIFVGMLLLGPVALKLGVTGYRFLRYYRGSPEYLQKGPPAPLMRVVVAPILVLSTLTLFGTGVGLLVFGRGVGMLSPLHKASFIVWFGATAIHVLAYAPRAARYALAERTRPPIGGGGVRIGLLFASIVVGLGIAFATLPQARAWTRFGVGHYYQHDGVPAVQSRHWTR